VIRAARKALIAFRERLVRRKLDELRAEVTGVRHEAEALQQLLAPAPRPEPLGGVAVVYDSMGDRR
jgi:hypothetical protein